ncbi:CynX/NimT family MFS transporter [Patulibacter minatonensis]|uniref:CynX/NimT family MFS transporter n=1 Tax=Patulibacter minatonensis TaxID=298163 RepID=UPI000688EDED|nr:MFS transporter [Patulibacter minatonensis]
MSLRPDDAAAPRGVRGELLLLGVAVALFSLNLRPALVAVGPLAPQLRDDTGLSAASTSLLTTLPLVCFGLFATVAPRLGRRVGLERALLIALALLVGGIALRVVSPVVALFAGSAVAGAGIAIANVLLPGVVKRDFADRTGPMMAVYSVGLNGGAALAAGLTVPLQDALGLSWRGALALWAVAALATAALWLPRALGAAPAPVAASAHARGVWRSRVAWAVALFMGLQSLEFYAMSAWLPTLLQDDGTSASTAGLLVALMSVASIGASLVVPVLAARSRRQRGLTAFAAGCFAIGLVGLLVAPSDGALAWVLVLGLGQGTGISLALTLFVLRSRTPEGAGELSGMAQTVGYLIAAGGPLGAGALHDLSGGWTLPLVALLVLLVAMVPAGWRAGADRMLEDPSPAEP